MSKISTDWKKNQIIIGIHAFGLCIIRVLSFFPEDVLACTAEAIIIYRTIGASHTTIISKMNGTLCVIAIQDSKVIPPRKSILNPWEYRPSYSDYNQESDYPPEVD